jgi:hypothetical protein
MVLFGKKILALIYKVLKKLTRFVSLCVHNYAIYINGRTVWKAVKRSLAVHVSAQLVKEHKKLWCPLSPVIPGVFIKGYVALTGVKSANFVPDNIYYTVIEPILNNALSSAGYEDKAQIDWFHDKQYVPRIILRNIHGVYYDENRSELQHPQIKIDKHEFPKVIVKPSIESQGGRDIRVFSAKDKGWFTQKGEELTVDFLQKAYEQNFVLQEFVEQHPFYNQFNASSVNTMRVMTYRSVRDNTIHVLGAVLRVGQNGKEVDNQSQGGFAIGIENNGKLKNYALDIAGIVSDSLADGKIKLESVGQVYMIDEVKRVAGILAANHYHSRILGFDLCVDKNSQVKLIEVNNMDIGFDLIQYLVGPLLGDLTEEVIDYCKKHLPSLKNQLV